MPTNKNVKDLVINHVESQEVFDQMLSENLINDDEFYLINGVKTGKSAVMIEFSSSTSNYKLEQEHTYDEIVGHVQAGVPVYLYITYSTGELHVYRSVGLVKYSEYNYIVPEFELRYNDTSSSKLIVHPESAYPDGNVIMTSRTLVTTEYVDEKVTEALGDIEAALAAL